MKNHESVKRLLFLLFIATIITVACQKEVTQEQATLQQRNTGAIFDTPEDMVKVPMIVSEEFLQRGKVFSLGKGPKNPKGYKDVTPPQVGITSPASGSTVTGTVLISVEAIDNVGIKSVTIGINGSTIAVLSQAPYTYSWNTDPLGDGTYAITATASDIAGNTATTQVAYAKNTQIKVQPGSSTPPPTSGYSLLMPPVGNQGSEFSCVAFAAGYSAWSAEKYYRTFATTYNNSVNVFSPEFLYNQTKVTDCGSGTSYVRVLEFMKTYGICTWQSMPYSSTNGCTLMPSASQSAEALNNKIISYSGIYTTDVIAIKNALLAKHPVMITVVLDNTFNNAGPGFVWTTYSGSGGFNHALCIVGYDDSKNAFKVMNSWGTNWGDAGYSWINYTFLSQVAGTWAIIID